MWCAYKKFCRIKIQNVYVQNNHESKKAKGINKNVVDDALKNEEYKNVLFYRSYMKVEMNRIQSKDHNMRWHRIHKIALFSYNDKKYILKGGYGSLSHFINQLVII